MDENIISFPSQWIELATNWAEWLKLTRCIMRTMALNNGFVSLGSIISTSTNCLTIKRTQWVVLFTLLCIEFQAPAQLADSTNRILIWLLWYFFFGTIYSIFVRESIMVTAVFFVLSHCLTVRNLHWYFHCRRSKFVIQMKFTCDDEKLERILRIELNDSLIASTTLHILGSTVYL